MNLYRHDFIKYNEPDEEDEDTNIYIDKTEK